jgi:hypothetical protein
LFVEGDYCGAGDGGREFELHNLVQPWSRQLG